MHLHKRLVAVIPAVLIGAGLIAVAQPAHAATVPVAGTGTATAHSVRLQASLAAPALGTPGVVLGKDGKPAGPAGARTASPGSRPAPPSKPNAAGGPNTQKSQSTVIAGARSSPLTDPSFRGAGQGNSNCSTCPTPYVTGAVSATQVAETVNLSLQVFSKSGTLLCAHSLTDLFGAIGGLTEPRIQYDNAAKRYSMVVVSVPTTSSDVPVFYLATSQADDACGAWWVYQIVLTGHQYPLGGQLNYPYLGQDSTSLLASTNNYTFGTSYLGTGAFAMPKAAAYTGDPFNVTTYSVDFSTAPATVAGIPTFSTTTTYWVAAVPGSGYDVFSMPTSPAGAITFVGTAFAPFNPPSRLVRQPGTSHSLDPLDGRLQSSVVQDGNFVWFTNDTDFNGFPTPVYGAINVINGAVTSAIAFHTNTSDDFNPSIGVSDQGSGTVAIWLNWAYTDTAAGVPVSATINGVAPGNGVPNLTGTDLTLVTGTSTTTSSVFGAYSSVEIDPVASSPTCRAGLTALSAQEFFPSATQWGTYLARTSFC